MTEEIKPCPFCGSNNDLSIISYGTLEHGHFYVQCKKCGANGPQAKINKNNIDHLLRIHDKAIKAWNQRPYDYDMPAIVKKIQQLQLENDKTKATLKIYANRDEWSSEAKFEYETGNLLATGDYETDEGSVCLDGDLYWCGYGNDGYELAEKVLGELESCKQPE